MKKKYNAPLIKPYNENANGQEADKKDVVADEKSPKKNLDNVPDEKPSKATTLGRCNYESNYWNILPDELLEKILLYVTERSGYTLPDL